MDNAPTELSGDLEAGKISNHLQQIKDQAPHHHTGLEEVLEEALHDKPELAKLHRLQFWFEPFISFREAVTLFFRFAVLTDLLIAPTRNGPEIFVIIALLFNIGNKALADAFQRNFEKHEQFMIRSQHDPTPMDELIEKDFQRSQIVSWLFKVIATATEIVVIIVMLLLFATNDGIAEVSNFRYDGNDVLLLATAVTEIVRLCTKAMIDFIILGYVQPSLQSLRKGIIGC